jgi:PelA/Pel-15E family pectate lyase
MLSVMSALTACAASDSLAPADDTPVTGAPVTLPDYTGTLLASSRLSALPSAERAAWDAYILRSRTRMAADLALVQQELKRASLPAVVRPPNTASDFAVSGTWTPSWVQSAAGRAMVATVRSYQTASGGWGKHIDYSKGPRTAGMGYNSESDEWAYVGTIDNGATVTELRLMGVAATAGDTAAASAFSRGVNWLADAQFPNGCWPQVFPLMGGYHDAATNNDDASVNVLRLLRDVAAGMYAAADAATRTRAGTMYQNGIGCLVASQVVVNGARTAWAQQHDPVTRAPTVGRSYELPGIAGREGARVMDVLMEDVSPSAAMIIAVHAAAAYYRSTAIPGVVYVSGEGLRALAGEGPLWPRIMELGSNRAIFANRDGVLLYDFALLTDRRTGYNWYGNEPATSLRTYDSNWARRYPAPAAAGQP